MVAVFSVVSSTSFPQHKHLSCACLTQLGCRNWWFFGRRTHSCMFQLVQWPALCVGLEICLYFTGTKCHRCSHTTKECSTQSSIIGFSSENYGREHAAVINCGPNSPQCLCKISAWVYITDSYIAFNMQRQELSGCLASPSFLPAHLELLLADQSCELRKVLQ